MKTKITLFMLLPGRRDRRGSGGGGMRGLALAVLGLSFFARPALSAAAPRAPEAAGGKEWTIMVFLNGKNDLESFALKDMNEMETVGSSDRINIVVELGRMAGYDSSDGDWQSVRRYLVKKDNDPKRIASAVLRELGKADMGDWRRLADFGKWAKAAYPARKYMLIVWNHGTGWDKSRAPDGAKGISYDDETGSHIDTPQLGMALREIGGVDVYGSDACLMQMPEVAYEIVDYAEYIVGSEEIEPNDGYPYNVFLGALAAAPGMDAAELAKTVVDAYGDHYLQAGKSTTQSMLKPSLLGGYAALVDDFVKATLAADEKVLVRAAAFGAQNYAGYDNRDMWHFLQLYSAATGNEVVRARARALQSYISGALIVHNRTTGKFTDGNSRGLAVYLPAYYFDKYYGELAWAKDTRWDDLVKWYLSK